MKENPEVLGIDTDVNGCHNLMMLVIDNNSWAVSKIRLKYIISGAYF